MTAGHTTLKVSKRLIAKLKEIGDKDETYEDIIWGLIGSKKDVEKKLASEENEEAENKRRKRKATIVREGEWRPVDDVL